MFAPINMKIPISATESQQNKKSVENLNKRSDKTSSPVIPFPIHNLIVS